MIKAQALVSFIAKCSVPDEQKVEDSKLWMLYVDESTTNGETGARFIIVSSKGNTNEHALQFILKTSNNEAKYEALLADMEIYDVLGVEDLKAFFNF